MANEKNLKSFRERTESERREIAIKGGIASGEARRERKQLRDCMNILLDLQPGVKDWNKLSKMGLQPEEIDNRMLMVAALFQRAVKYGDVGAVKEIRAIIGDDKPTDETLRRLDEVLGKIEGNI